MSKEKAFYNKSGGLSGYGLACGYVQKFEKMGQSLEMYKEGGVFHVRQFNLLHERIFWDTFELLGDARKRFHSAAVEIESVCYIQRGKK